MSGGGCLGRCTDSETVRPDCSCDGGCGASKRRGGDGIFLGHAGNYLYLRYKVSGPHSDGSWKGQTGKRRVLFLVLRQPKSDKERGALPAFKGFLSGGL